MKISTIAIVSATLGNFHCFINDTEDHPVFFILRVLIELSIQARIFDLLLKRKDLRQL